MRTNRKDFLKAILLVKEFGLCPVCHEKGHLSKSGSNTYHCSYCGYITIFEKDKAIMGCYKILYGERILESFELPSSSPRWKAILEEAQKLKRKRKFH